MRRVLERLLDAGARSCLDFACGTGRILQVAESYFEETAGVDVSETMLDKARICCKRSVLHKLDITRAPLGAKFDVVTAFRFFLNAEQALRHDALDAIRGALVDRGVLVSNIHVNSKSTLGYAYRLRNYINRQNLGLTEGLPQHKALLESHGFEVEDVFWYSFLPRTGWWLPWIPKYFMQPVEYLCNALPFVPNDCAQSFLVVSRKG